MRKSVLILVVIVAVFFAGCGVKPTAELWVLNMADGISGDVLLDFERERNAKVIYNTYETPDELYQILTENPKKYDVVFATNYITQRLRAEGAFAEIDKNKLENFKNIERDYLPSGALNIPYMTGTFGILYDENRAFTKIDSWQSLWDNRYRNEIIMTPARIPAISIAFKSLGYDINDTDQRHIDEARIKLEEQYGIVQSYQTLNIAENMAWGRAILAAATSNEAFMAIAKAKEMGYTNLKYIIPNEGSARWIISMSIMKNSKNAELAMQFIDYMCDRDVSAKNSIATGLTSVIEGVRNSLPEDMKDSYVLYPSFAEIRKCIFWKFDINANPKYETMWRVIKANIWMK